MNNIATLQFQPDMITDTHGTSNSALGLGVTMRQGPAGEEKPYLRWIMSNETARSIGLRVGSRVTFGISEDRQTMVIAPAPGSGWKLTKQGDNSVTVMVIAEKLKLTPEHGRPVEPQRFIRYDSQLVVDISNFHTQA